MSKPEIHPSSVNKVIIGEEVNKYIEEVVMNEVNARLQQMRTEIYNNVYNDMRLSIERATAHHIPLYELALKDIGYTYPYYLIPSITNNPLGSNYIGFIYCPEKTAYGIIIGIPSFEILTVKQLTSDNYYDVRTSYRLLTYADPYKAFAVTVKEGQNGEYMLCRFTLPSLDEEYCVELTNIQRVYTSSITKDGEYVLVQGYHDDWIPFAEIRKTFNFDVISHTHLDGLYVGGDISSNYVCLQSGYDTLTLYNWNFNIINTISYIGAYEEAHIDINEDYGRIGVCGRYSEEYTLPDLNFIRRYYMYGSGDTSFYGYLYFHNPGQVIYSPDNRFLIVFEGDRNYMRGATLIIDLKTGKFRQLSGIRGYIGDVSNDYIVVVDLTASTLSVFKYRHLFPPV